MISLVTFEPMVTLGNLLTIGSFIIVASISFASIRERSRANALFAKQLKERMDHCNLEQIKERVDTMWIFQMRRGLAELEKKSLGYVSSPIKLTETANAAIAPLVPRLREFYRAVGGSEMGVIELAVKIEQEFGKTLAATVCKHVGISDGACLMLAMAQLRQIGPEDIDISAEKNLRKVHRSMGIGQIETPLPIRKMLLGK